MYLTSRRLRRLYQVFAVGGAAADCTAHSKNLLRTTAGGEKSWKVTISKVKLLIYKKSYPLLLIFPFSARKRSVMNI